MDYKYLQWHPTQADNNNNSMMIESSLFMFAKSAFIK